MSRPLSATEAAILEIWERRHALSAEIVVEEATPPGSPLHPAFEWDDKVAGHRYRLGQAADLIRACTLTVTRTEPDGEVRDYQVRRFTAADRAQIPDLPPGRYVPTADLDPVARQMVLQRMMRELQALRRRYEAYAEFWEQVDQMARGHNGGQQAS